MKSLFDEEEEPSLRVVTRYHLTLAYARVLAEKGPYPAVRGKGQKAEENRRRISRRDVGFLFDAAAACGCSIQLVALPRHGSCPSAMGARSETPPEKEKGDG